MSLRSLVSLKSLAFATKSPREQGGRRLPGEGRPGSGSDRHFEHTVPPLLEEVIGLLDTVEREGMRDQRGEIHPSATDGLDQSPHPLFPARAEGGDNAVVAEAGRESVIWHLQFARVDPEAGEGASRPQAAQAILERLLRAQGLDG